MKRDSSLMRSQCAKDLCQNRKKGPDEADFSGGLEGLLLWGKRELSELGLFESQANAEQLLEEVLGLCRIELYLDAGRFVPENKAKKYRHLISLRKKRIPLAYLTGKVFFCNEALEVTNDCLIPRPETEVLVEKFAELSGFKKTEAFSFLDLGAGSGAIGIAVEREFPFSRGTFSDISEKALAVAKRNLARCGLDNRSQIVCSDLFQMFRGAQSRVWDVILSNPPYFCAEDWGTLQPEISYEPRLALDGGIDGLDFYRAIIRQAGGHLTDGGRLMFEVGRGQAEKVSKIFEENSYRDIRMEKDYSGIQRIVTAQAVFRG